MIDTLYVFANMGKLKELPKSGGQTSARRVMKGFQSEGIKIVPIRRHRAECQSKLGHVIEVGFFAFFDLFKMIVKMLFKTRKNAAFLQMTYAGALVPYEFLLSFFARLLGYKCAEYLQGGMMMDTYPRGGRLHKWLYKKNMEMQALVLFEGIDALKLTESVTQKPRLIYLPSYIFDDKIPDRVPEKPKNELNFCFFGRISEQKKVLTTIEIFNIFCQKHSSVKSSLTIVGSGDNKDYLNRVTKAIEESPYRNCIYRFGNSPYEFLVQMMQNQHFYLFPTKEKAEGHSNALNEAMSQGVIPIACDYHFNKSVIGEDCLVVEGYDPNDYVAAIEYILDNDLMNSLSFKLWNRVKTEYAYSVVNPHVCRLLKTI